MYLGEHNKVGKKGYEIQGFIEIRRGLDEGSMRARSARARVLPSLPFLDLKELDLRSKILE